MRRIVMLLTVVALMVGMLAMSVAPAFARWEVSGCRTGDRLVTPANTDQDLVDQNLNGSICRKETPKGFHYYDDRPVVI